MLPTMAKAEEVPMPSVHAVTITTTNNNNSYSTTSE